MTKHLTLGFFMLYFPRVKKMVKHGEGIGQPTFTEVILSTRSYRGVATSENIRVRAVIFALKHPALNLSTASSLKLLFFSVGQVATNQADSSGRNKAEILRSDFGMDPDTITDAEQSIDKGVIDQPSWEIFSRIARERETALTPEIAREEALLAHILASKEDALAVDVRTRRVERDRE